MIQHILVVLILCLSVGYAVWRIRKTVIDGQNPCAGCKGCDLKKAIKKQAATKKTCEKFGQDK
jgi:hypothetical protein